MPIKLIDPRPGKTPFYAGRGTYLGHYVDRSTKARKKSVAKKVIQKWMREIERGEFAAKDPLSFAAAAAAYMQAGGDAGRLVDIIGYFKDRAAAEIDQVAIDGCAAHFYPDGTAPTKNREVYTPISAVLKHAGVKFAIKRPKGWRGSKRTDWLTPDRAFTAIRAAYEVDKEFGLFLTFLLYTGPRLSEALRLGCDDVQLREAFAYIGRTKNSEPRPVHLTPLLVAEMANHPRGLDRPGQRVFRFTKCGRLYELLGDTSKRCGFKLGFHLFCHTWATWMRRYGGLDIQGLVSTQRWKDPASAARYTHVVVAEEARRADLLPVDNLRIRRIAGAK